MKATANVAVFDTTLRDGEQAAGTRLGRRDKIALARQLARLRVDIIEAGFPALSPEDFDAVQRRRKSKGRRSAHCLERFRKTRRSHDMNQTDLDQLRLAYKSAVDEWVNAIRSEEALATQPIIRRPLWRRRTKPTSRNKMHKRSDSNTRGLSGRSPFDKLRHITNLEYRCLRAVSLLTWRGAIGASCLFPPPQSVNIASRGQKVGITPIHDISRSSGCTAAIRVGRQDARRLFRPSIGPGRRPM
jgi:hypothetical protein